MSVNHAFVTDSKKTLQGLHPHHHCCMISDSMEEEIATALSFLKFGLSRKEKCFFITNQENIACLQTEFQKKDADVAHGIRTRSIHSISAEEFYFPHQSFDPDSIIRFLEGITTQALAEGYQASRLIGILSYQTSSPIQLEKRELIRYESQVNQFFQNHQCLAICIYNRQYCSPDMIHQAIRVHPYILYRNRLCRNFYYIPAEELTTPEDISREVEQMLSNLFKYEEAEEALWESKTRYANLLSNLPGIAYRCRNDPTYTMEFISDGCKELTGYEKQDFIHNRSISYHEIISPLFRDSFRRNIQKALEKKTAYEMMYPISTKNGLEKWVWEKGRGIFDGKGDLLYLQGFISDISEFKQAEEERESLRRLAQRLTVALNANDICHIVAEESKRMFKHDALWIYLYDKDNKRILLNYHEDTPNGKKEPVEIHQEINYVESLITKPLLINREDIISNNTLIPFGDVSRLSKSLMFVPVRWENSINGTVSVQSYTAHKYGEREIALLQTIADQCSGAFTRIKVEEKQLHLEKQLQQSQKLHAISQLAGGVAHDFNNLLTGIIGNLNLAEMKANPESQKFLINAKEAANRAANLVQHLLSFSRKSITELKPLNLNLIVNDVFDLARQLIDPRIEILVDTQSNLPLIYGDQVQIKSVLMNLCINARDAIEEMLQGVDFPKRKEDRFTIIVETRSQFLQRKSSSENQQPSSQNYAILRVTDNGAGMDPELLNRIFEPFFTTKKVGKGVGLGLASVYGIIEQHDGWIETKSERGVGSSFSIYLPAMGE